MPLDPTSGIAQSGTLNLNGTGTKSTDGTHSGRNIGKEFLGVGSTGQVAMSSLYRAGTTTASGGPVTGSDINTAQGIPTSGQIEMSDFYKTSNAIDPTDFLSENVYGRANLASDNANGQFAMARGGSNAASTSRVQYSTSMSTVMENTRTTETGGGQGEFNNPPGSGVALSSAGYDLILKPSHTVSKSGDITAYQLGLFARPFGASATFYNSSGQGFGGQNTSTYLEIHRVTYTHTEASTTGFDQAFRYAPSQIGWRFASYDATTGPGGGQVSTVISNTGWATGTGASATSYMPLLAHNSNTVYTYGDGDGPHHASSSADSFISNTSGSARAFGCRLTMNNTFECSTATFVRRYAINFTLVDPSNSTDGSSFGNTSLNSAGIHSYVSPTFVFQTTLSNTHSGICAV